MTVLVSFFLLIVGFVILIKGADWFVDGAAGIAEKFGISQIVIGLTVVAMGTSAPEAAVSITSALKGNAGITIGNVLGSNIMNVLVILGITAVITQIPVKTMTMKREIPFTILITVLLGIIGWKAGQVGFFTGVVFWVLFILYLVYLFYMSKKGEYEPEMPAQDGGSEGNESGQKGTGALLLTGLLGAAGIILGSDLTVDSATEIAQFFGMSDRFIGLTIIAFGTSLPELVTSIAAALKKKADIAIGNIIGSNIFNILFVIGTTALITPVVYAKEFVMDAVIAAGAVVLLLIALLRTKTLQRTWGAVMLLCYAAYFVKITM